MKCRKRNFSLNFISNLPNNGTTFIRNKRFVKQHHCILTLLHVFFNLKHTAEIRDIVTALEAEGLGPEQCSSEEVVRVLFSRQKDFSLKLKEAEDVLSSCKNGDPRPVIQVQYCF